MSFYGNLTLAASSGAIVLIAGARVRWRYYNAVWLICFKYHLSPLQDLS